MKNILSLLEPLVSSITETPLRFLEGEFRYTISTKIWLTCSKEVTELNISKFGVNIALSFKEKIITIPIAGIEKFFYSFEETDWPVKAHTLEVMLDNNQQLEIIIVPSGGILSSGFGKFFAGLSLPSEHTPHDES